MVSRWRALAGDRSRWPTMLGAAVWVMLAGRLLAELALPPIRLRFVLMIIAASASVGLTLGVFIARRHSLSWVALIPGLYLLWPWPEPGMAVLLIAFVLALWAASRFSTERAWPAFVLAGGFLALYAVTLAPGLLPADSGEFQLVVATLGIAHPPGYALYTMLGRLATLVPLGDPARCINAFSALTSAATLLVLMRTVRRQRGSIAAALAPALMLGLAATYWAQATTANIRSLTALFTALCLATLLRWEQERDDRWLAWFALCFGLGVGHHASLALLGPPFLAFILFTDWRLVVEPRRWPWPVLALIAPFLVWLYLPIRSAMAPPFDPSPVRDWGSFWQHVLALGFGGDMFQYRTWNVLQPRLGVWAEIMRLEFGAVLPLLAATGAALVARRRWKIALLLIGAWLMNTLAAVTYRAPQTVEYLMPSYVALAFALGLGLVEVERSRGKRRILSTALALILCVVALLPVGENWRSFSALHRDDSTRQAAKAMLDAAPPDATILSSWHHATPMWYLQIVEGIRPDVSVEYVYPEGATPNDQVWLRRIEEGLEHGPVIVTNRYHAFADADLVWAPLAEGWQASRERPADIPAAATTLDVAFEDLVELLGCDTATETIAPGEVLDVRITWSALVRLEQNLTVFCQLVGPQGVIGQADLSHGPGMAPGEICVDGFQFPILTHAMPGTYQLIVGYYQIFDGAIHRLRTASGDHVVLTSVTVEPARDMPVTLLPRRERWASGLELIGVDFDKSVAGQTRLYLHWRQTGKSSGGAVAQLSTGGLPAAEVSLPELPAGAFQTLALDVPDHLREVRLLLLKDGAPSARLGPWHRDLREPLILRIPSGDVRYVPLGGEMALVDAGLPSAVSAGDKVWFRPRLLSTRALTRDYSMSLGLQGEGDWEEKSDGTPALGAIPTLKWVRGWQVTDPHKLDVPEEASGQRATVTLSVYDAFTLAPVPVLDERLVRQGQGVTLELGQITIE